MLGIPTNTNTHLVQALLEDISLQHHVCDHNHQIHMCSENSPSDVIHFQNSRFDK